MKKIKILSILLITIFMTGCVKLNATMKIHKDKSMDYEIIMAYDKSLIEKSGVSIDEETIKEASKNGFEAKEYNDGTMVGYKFTKHIKNIDSVSTSKDTVGSLDVNSENKYIFTVKKGILKNTYKAKLTSENTNLDGMDLSNTSYTSNENGLNYDTTLTTENSATNINVNSTNTDLIDSNNNLTNNDLTDGNIDYNSMKNMDLKFQVTLPYNAINSNATINNDKTLTWNLLTLNKDSNIEFEFELYNYQNIAIIGIIILVILIIIVLLLNKKGKNKKQNKNDNLISVDNNFGQANNISNVEESMQAQDVWTENSVQFINQPIPNMQQTPVYEQPINNMGQPIQQPTNINSVPEQSIQQPVMEQIPEQPINIQQPIQSSANVFEQELENNNQN